MVFEYKSLSPNWKLSDLSVYEMVGAYGAFANKGIYVKPIMVTKIEDKNGTIIFQSKPDIIGDSSIEWLKKIDRNKPFFMMTHFKATHEPFDYPRSFP